MLQFENRYQAIAYYDNERKKLDEELQDWLVHWETKKSEKILSFTKRLKELNDAIDWNRAELRKERGVLQNE